MPLPELNTDGELPVGVHSASLSEVLLYFGSGHSQRQAIAHRLQRIFETAHATAKVARFVVFGSFITDKAYPNDVDIFLLMEDSFDTSNLSGEPSLLFDHAMAQQHFGASVFWIRRLAAWEGESAAVEYWQVKRGGGQRGIVEIVRGES